MVSNQVVEEPISSELVLVDQALARRARAALPDPPWLLPVLAELRERAPVEPAPQPVSARPPAGRRRPSAASVFVLVGGLAATVVLSLAFFPLSRGPSLVTTPAERSAPAVPVRPPAVRDPKPVRKPTKPKPARSQPAAKPKQTRQRERPVAKTQAKRRASKPAPPPKPKPKPKPQALTRAQRTVAWRRYPAAVYYEVYLQSGAKTLYETRTLQPGAVLPARLTLMPGAYQVLVRPAIPGDAGIILGPTIVRRTIRL